MNALRRVFSRQLRNPHAEQRWRDAAALCGDDPIAAQKLSMLSSVLGCDTNALVEMMKKHCADLSMAPIVERYLQRAQRRWPVYNLPPTPHVTMFLGARTAGEMRNAIARGRILRPGPMNPAEDGFRFVSIGDQKLSVRVREGREPAIVFLPGRDTSSSGYAQHFFEYAHADNTIDPAFLEQLGAEGDAYREQVRALGEHTLIALDYPGVGYSDPYPDNARPRTWHDLADTVHAVLEKVGVSQAPILAAHSMSGPVSLAYHSRYGAAALNLYDSTHFSMIRGAHAGAIQPQRYYSFFNGDPASESATVLDLKRSAEMVAQAQYTEVPGVSFRNDSTSTASLGDDPIFHTLWREQGREVADRLGLTLVEAGNHNPLRSHPELTRFALAQTVETVVNNAGRVALDPQRVELLAGRLKNPEIIDRPPRSGPVTMQGVPRFPEDYLLPSLPEEFAEPTDRLGQIAALTGQEVPPQRASTSPAHGEMYDPLPPPLDLRQWQRYSNLRGAGVPFPPQVDPRISAWVIPRRR